MKLPLPDRSRSLSILKDVLSHPTAPFHEARVRRAITARLDALGIPWRADAYGNVVARYRRGRGARPVALTGHMDHPGFELVSVEGTRAEARWHGQVPVFGLRGLRLTLWSKGGEERRGTAVVLDGDGRRPKPACAKLALRVPRGARPGDFGHADLPAFRLTGGRIVSKALDNVAGCAAVLCCLDHLARRRLKADVLALFTRAEEAGFQGAFGALRAGTLPQGRPVVVLECSKALLGAEQGNGPVIRVGDKVRTFDPEVVLACEEAAQRLKEARKDLRYQRRLMDGGTCEASPYCAAGLRAVCLAFPLGNYHNNGPKGVAPEHIMERDFHDGVALLAAFAALGLDPRGAGRRLKARLDKRFEPEFRKKLLSTGG